MLRLHGSQDPMAGQRKGGIRGVRRDNGSYDDVLNLDECYFVYVCDWDPIRAHELKARKEAECRRKERMCTFPLS